MGVVYKLTPAVREYILKQRLSKPRMGCRKLVSLILDKFQINVSKSSINELIKTSGFNMPVGCRGKRSKMRYAGSGALFLKGIDLLVGGSRIITDIIKKNMSRQAGGGDIDNKTEALLFKSLNLGHAARLLFGWSWTDEELSAYFIELQKIEKIKTEVFNLCERVFQEIKCIKIEFNDGTHIFIDGQRHSVWPAGKILGIFSAAVYETDKYINRYVNTSEPFTLLQAAGYDTPTADFFNCVLKLTGNNAVSKIILLDNNLKELLLNDKTFLYKEKKHSLLFGLWPWQFTEYRKIKKTGEFKPFIFETLKDKLYIADIELELSHPIENKTAVLRGSVVRSAPDGQIRLFILTNSNEINFEDLARIYFTYWPNIEESFKDFSSKIEFYSKSFHYAGGGTAEQAGIKDNSSSIDSAFQQYMNRLNSYFRRYFLPASYQNNDFLAIKRDFYDLKAVVKKQNNYILVNFKPPAGCLYLDELKYACRRMNEKLIFLQDGKRLIYRVS